MWLTWLFVIFAVAMVVGPIMMLRPSPGMTKLAAIRAYANKCGVVIHLPCTSSSGRGAPLEKGAFYGLGLEGKLRKLGSMEPWALEKGAMNHEIHFDKRWDWRDHHRPRDIVHNQLRSILRSIPEGISVIEFNSISMSVLWDENCRGKNIEEAVDAIISVVVKLKEVVAVMPLPVEADADQSKGQ